MKNLIFAVMLALAACSGTKSDLEIGEGDFLLRAPISIDSVLLTDVWSIHHGTLDIIRQGDTVYHQVNTLHGKKYEFFPNGQNPYYDEDLSGATIISVDWGFYLYPKSNKTFCLEKI